MAFGFTYSGINVATGWHGSLTYFIVDKVKEERMSFSSSYVKMARFSLNYCLHSSLLRFVEY